MTERQLTTHKIIKFDDGEGVAWSYEIPLTSIARLIPGCVAVKGPTHDPFYLVGPEPRRTTRLPKEAR